MWVGDARRSAGGGASKSWPGQNTYQSSSEVTHPSVPAGQSCQATKLHWGLEEVEQLISSEYLRHIYNCYEISLLERDLTWELIVSFRLDSPAFIGHEAYIWWHYDLSNHLFDTIALAISYIVASFSLVAIQSYQLKKSILYKLFIIDLFIYVHGQMQS